MTLTVDQRSSAVARMAEQWPIVEALMSGTPGMRSAGKRYLPQWPNENDESYKNRLDTATLYPVFQRTVSVMSGKPFAKPLTLSKDTPDQIRTWSDDVDNEGVNLHSFAEEMFTEAVAFGFGGILVDSPKRVATSGSRPPTQAEQKAQGVRPYWVRVKHSDILGYRFKRIGGVATLTQVRLLESDTEDDGPYGEKEVSRIRVLTPGAFEVWQTGEKQGEWERIEEGKTGLNFIPFVPIYGRRAAFMVGAPPLLDLAYLNVKHWQSQSDQDTILHVARVPILLFRSLGEDVNVVVGGSAAINATSESADGKYIEHSGEAIGAGRQSLIDLEEQCIASGAELMVRKPGIRTATEDMNDAEGNKCDLQRMAEGMEDAIDLALYYTSAIASLPTGGRCTLFKDFGAGTLTEASGQLINDMQSRGLITRVTAIKEQQRRGILSADIDPQKEVDDAANEGPAPGTLIDDDADSQ